MAEVIIRDARGRKLTVGSRVYVITRPLGVKREKGFHGIVGPRTTPESIQVFDIRSCNEHHMRPARVRVQYGRIDGMSKFEDNLDNLQYGVAGGRDFPDSPGKKSDLARAVQAYKRRNGRDTFNTTHRLILENVLACRREKQSRPGYEYHSSNGSVSIVSSSRLIRNHVEELVDAGAITIDNGIAGCYFPAAEINENAVNPIAEFIKGEQVMAKEEAKAAEAKAPKVKKSKSKVDFSEVTPEDFFRENAKGVSVFKPGHDARYAGVLKRVAEGTASAAEKKLAFNKKMTEHPKVANSAHFKHLLEAAQAAA